MNIIFEDQNLDIMYQMIVLPYPNMCDELPGHSYPSLGAVYQPYRLCSIGKVGVVWVLFGWISFIYQD